MGKNAKSTEDMIQEKGLNAPRLNPQHIEQTIKHEAYVNGGDVANMNDVPDGNMALLTICILELQNGFTVVGKSACASPANFDEEIGKKVAREDAVRQIWALEGYLLKQGLHSTDKEG